VAKCVELNDKAEKKKKGPTKAWFTQSLVKDGLRNFSTGQVVISVLF